MPDPTEARYDKYGFKTTQSGVDWSERMLDLEYVSGLTQESDYEPDYDLYDDRDYDNEDWEDAHG